MDAKWANLLHTSLSKSTTGGQIKIRINRARNLNVRVGGWVVWAAKGLEGGALMMLHKTCAIGTPYH